MFYYTTPSKIKRNVYRAWGNRTKYIGELDKTERNIL